VFGRVLSGEAILAEVERDQVFHRRSGGGVTFTGGEATGQPKLLAFLAEQLGRSGTHLALETCGHFAWTENEAALSRMDLVYLDLKHMDSTIHQRLTGAGNDLILENAVRIAGLGVAMIIRLPLVPGLNDSEENLEATARFVAGQLGQEVPIQVLPYHALGCAKYQAIDERYGLPNLPPPSLGAVAQAQARLAACGAKVAV
jgi:pyruvate formate lyase activating enzyme